MNLRTFKGGVHPPENKKLSSAYAVENAMPSTKTVVIPVTQGGAPNVPCVSVGNSVAKGQVIADGTGAFSVPVHASIAGIVKKIEMRLVTGNTEALCIVIESDGTDRTSYLEPLDPFSAEKSAAIERIRLCGIVGMGGAAFPAHVKLNVPEGKTIDCVIANAAECEPYLTIDERALVEDAEKLVDGLAISMHLTGAKRAVIAVEDNKAYTVEHLEQVIAQSGKKDISVQLVKTKYPQGGEKMLVKAVLNREIPSKKLPADAGCVIQNVGTLIAMSDAFRLGKPLVERALTISGGTCEVPKNLRVPVGTMIGDLIPEVIKLKPGVKKIISGGPMMGFAMMNSMFPVQKNTSGVLFLTEKEVSLLAETPCIGCGNCVNACPCGLTPVMMLRSIKAENLDAAAKYGLMDCIECGSCSFVCPAKVRLVQYFRLGKMNIRAAQAKAKEKAAAEAQKGAN
ncbi:MAG: electron transport complex subunit RsxC [Treponemataceae bacterium]|nr:electron transport complex subunit RsxC [Treponemataceae bacterium]